MAVLTIRNIEESVKNRLRMRAASHGRSMEDELRRILNAAVKNWPDGSPGLATRIREAFDSLGEVDFSLPPRELPREPPKLDE